MLPGQLDLFALANGPMLTPKEHRALARSTRSKKRGHAAAPGTGPKGETCGSCEHLCRRQLARAYPKCALTRAVWTGGAGTDVRVRDPACSLWEKSK